MTKVDYLSLDDLVQIGESIIDDFRVRDLGLLESAALRPQTSVFGKDAYPEFAEKVAALMHSIARNHALIDGNKRLSWAAGRIFCLMNGRDLRFQIDDAEQLILGIARGDLDVKDIASILEEHIIVDS